jgi:hypothetical protein
LVRGIGGSKIEKRAAGEVKGKEGEYCNIPYRRENIIPDSKLIPFLFVALSQTFFKSFLTFADT